MANRKRNRQLETGGLVVTRAVYGSRKALRNRTKNMEETGDDAASQILDVTLPLNFLVNDSGQLKVCLLSFYDYDIIIMSSVQYIWVID